MFIESKLLLNDGLSMPPKRNREAPCLSGLPGFLFFVEKNQQKRVSLRKIINNPIYKNQKYDKI